MKAGDRGAVQANQQINRSTNQQINKSTYKILLSTPQTSGYEGKYLKDALVANELSLSGKQVDQFRERLQKLTGSEYLLPLSSGTAALQLALKVLGIGEGDYVACSTFTYAASAFPITYIGATPVFIDSEPQSWNIDLNVLEETDKKLEAQGSKLKAIIAVHIYGMPCGIESLVEVRKKYDIHVIEDAAESIGSTIGGQHTGTFGDLGVLSFNGNKIITTSGGGALLGKNSKYISFAKKLASQAREEGIGYTHQEIGYNYLMGNINAAVGLGQLEVLNKRIKRRRKVFEIYQSELSGLEVGFQNEPEDSFSNRWLTCVLFKDFKIREKVRLALEQNHIEARPLWKPMHLQSVFKDADYFGGNVADGLFNRGLCLPSGTDITEQDLGRIIEIIRKVFNRRGRKG